VSEPVRLGCRLNPAAVFLGGLWVDLGFSRGPAWESGILLGEKTRRGVTPQNYVPLFGRQGFLNVLNSWHRQDARQAR